MKPSLGFVLLPLFMFFAFDWCFVFRFMIQVLKLVFKRDLMDYSRISLSIVAFVSFSLWSTVTIFAQGTDLGNIRGNVTERSGAVVTKAKVVGHRY
jgi:hypothetical protein